MPKTINVRCLLVNFLPPTPPLNLNSAMLIDRLTRSKADCWYGLKDSNLVLYTVSEGVLILRTVITWHAENVSMFSKFDLVEYYFWKKSNKSF